MLRHSVLDARAHTHASTRIQAFCLRFRLTKLALACALLCAPGEVELALLSFDPQRVCACGSRVV